MFISVVKSGILTWGLIGMNSRLKPPLLLNFSAPEIPSLLIREMRERSELNDCVTEL